MFHPIPTIVDGSFTSNGENACYDEKHGREVRFILRTDGGFRTCSGRFLPALAQWGDRLDVLAIMCAADEQLMVIADGTVWSRTDSRSPFRPVEDCSPYWNGRKDHCRDMTKTDVSLGGPSDLCDSSLDSDGGWQR
jgi:hypothetical protein